MNWEFINSSLLSVYQQSPHSFVLMYPLFHRFVTGLPRDLNFQNHHVCTGLPQPLHQNHSTVFPQALHRFDTSSKQYTKQSRSTKIFRSFSTIAAPHFFFPPGNLFWPLVQQPCLSFLYMDRTNVSFGVSWFGLWLLKEVRVIDRTVGLKAMGHMWLTITLITLQTFMSSF